MLEWYKYNKYSSTQLYWNNSPKDTPQSVVNLFGSRYAFTDLEFTCHFVYTRKLCHLVFISSISLCNTVKNVNGSLVRYQRGVKSCMLTMCAHAFFTLGLLFFSHGYLSSMSAWFSYGWWPLAFFLWFTYLLGQLGSAMADDPNSSPAPVGCDLHRQEVASLLNAEPVSILCLCSLLNIVTKLLYTLVSTTLMLLGWVELFFLTCSVSFYCSICLAIFPFIQVKIFVLLLVFKITIKMSLRNVILVRRCHILLA
jgi:hypothetical protein